MRRKGETLMEFVVALTVFGMMTAGIFEFMANQTENLADIRNKDDLIFYAQKYMNTPKEKRPANNTPVDDDNKTEYNINSDETTLTVTKPNVTPITFELKP